MPDPDPQRAEPSQPQPAQPQATVIRTVDFTDDPPPSDRAPMLDSPFNQNEVRESTRSDLARGLIWLLAFAIGGVMLFIETNHIEGTVLTQAVFPSLIALAGTALGFYFGAQAARADHSGGNRLGDGS